MAATAQRLTDPHADVPPEQGPFSTRPRDARVHTRDHTGFVRAACVWRAQGAKAMAMAPGLREELANTASHAVGALLALAALPVLAADDAARSNGHPAGVWVFAATMLLVYVVSSMYHAAPANHPTKSLLKRLDHAAIYLFMAGTFTPFALGHALGAPLLALVWTVAAAGVALKMAGYLRNRTLSTGLYLAFGWLVIAAAQPLLASLGREGVLWLLAGGIAYTAGVLFFVLDQRLRFGHLVWHMLVLVGSGCHFVAVLKHVA
jgi:hemolysin III